MLLLLLAAALAQDPADDDDIATIVVQDTLSVEEAQQALSETLESEGYFRQVQRDGDVIFRHAEAWRPVVLVSPEGSVRVRRRGIVLRPPRRDWSPDQNAGDLLGCLTPWTLVSCFSAQGLVTDHRKMQGRKTAVAATIHEDVVGLQDALSAERIDERVRGELHAIWHEGRAPDGTELPDPVSRRAAIGALWASRAPTEWGRRAQDLIARYAEIEVQRSATPFTAQEVADIEARAAVRRTFLDLGAIDDDAGTDDTSD